MNYILRVFIQRGLGVLMFLLGSWWTMNLRAWVYFIGYFLITIISCYIMHNVNKETLAERGKINTDSPKWDKIILTIYWLLTFFVIYLVAGLEMNKADKPGIIFVIGIILQIPVTIISLKAMMVNTFLESTSRVQFDRSQIVCKEGPYKIIRHPTYLAILIWCISISMIFETKLVLIISIIIAGLIVIRTYLEDKMLKEKLKGYEQYSHEVKYRLIPLIW